MGCRLPERGYVVWEINTDAVLVGGYEPEEEGIEWDDVA